MSQDPIGFAGGTSNLYGYCGNGPACAADPMGLQAAPSGATPLVPAQLLPILFSTGAGRTALSVLRGSGTRPFKIIAYPNLGNPGAFNYVLSPGQIAIPTGAPAGTSPTGANIMAAAALVGAAAMSTYEVAHPKANDVASMAAGDEAVAEFYNELLQVIPRNTPDYAGLIQAMTSFAKNQPGISKKYKPGQPLQWQGNWKTKFWPTAIVVPAAGGNDVTEQILNPDPTSRGTGLPNPQASPAYPGPMPQSPSSTSGAAACWSTGDAMGVH